MTQEKTLSHVNQHGEANMVDVTDKSVTQRVAYAQGNVLMSPKTLSLINNQQHAKGDVFAVARIAGIQGAKKCSDLIPLCHPLMLTKVQIDFATLEDESGIRISAMCKLAGQTGVEMEALTAVSAGLLTIYDMCKAVDKGMTIGDIKLLQKTGGKSGDWNAPAEEGK